MNRRTFITRMMGLIGLGTASLHIPIVSESKIGSGISKVQGLTFIHDHFSDAIRYSLANIPATQITATETKLRWEAFIADCERRLLL